MVGKDGSLDSSWSWSQVQWGLWDGMSFQGSLVNGTTSGSSVTSWTSGNNNMGSMGNNGYWTKFWLTERSCYKGRSNLTWMSKNVDGSWNVLSNGDCWSVGYNSCGIRNKINVHFITLDHYELASKMWVLGNWCSPWVSSVWPSIRTIWDNGSLGNDGQCQQNCDTLHFALLRVLRRNY